MTLQYLSGSSWVSLQTFHGNVAGFTELSNGLDNGWIRFGSNSVRVISGTCASGDVTFTVTYDQSAIGYDFGVYGAILALCLAFVLVGRRLGAGRFLIFAIPVYLLLAPWTGQRYDVYFLLSSGIRVLQHVNPFDPGNPPLYPGSLKWAYPPLYTLYSALSFLAYQAVTGAQLPAVGGLTWPGWLTSTYNVYQAYVTPGLPFLVFLLKLPMVASALITGVILKRMSGSDSMAVLWVANPLVILVAALWGQLDPIATMFALLAVYFFQKEKEYHAYLFASLGAAVKVWPALIIPIMIVMSVNRKGMGGLRPVVSVVPVAVLTVALYGIYGSALNSILVFAYARGIPTFAGAFSVNGLTWQQYLLASASPPLPIFLYVGIPAYALMLAWIRLRKDYDIIKWTIVAIMMLFATYNYVNPQYFYWVVPLLYLKRRKVAAAVFTALPILYMLLAYDVFYFVSPSLLADQNTIGASVFEELKVSYFYQSFDLRVLAFGVVPLLIYVMTAVSEFRPGLLPNLASWFRIHPMNRRREMAENPDSVEKLKANARSADP